MQEVKLPVGRLVGGHPMELHAVIDDKTKQPKMQKDNVIPMVDCYVGVAIPKGAETDWKQTPWGQQIYNEGVNGWPNGEHASPTFAWKITDGDSQIPNKKGNKPFEREGYPGHWIVNAKQGWPIPCFHVGHYEPHQVIQDKNEIKCGDYVRLVVNALGNAPSPSPGVYLNPISMEISRAGVQIVTKSSVDAAALFSDSAPVLPANAQVDPNVATPAPTPGTAAPSPGIAVAPAPDILTPAPAAIMQYNVNGTLYTVEQLKASNWTDAQIAALPPS